MPIASRQKSAFDRSSLVAYAGVGAAIAFIAAMTIGMIDAPSQDGRWTADASQAEPTHLVSAAPVSGEPQVR